MTKSATEERRAARGPRVHFEAMVAVGGDGGGFEAESVDVSRQGMRLRTAYLPEVGEQIVCRFDGAEGEIVVVGEVTWISEEARGGEFGLKFVDLDDETAAALRGLCETDEESESEADEAAAPAPPKGAAPGTRVKLHIEGLGSPMKARVKDGTEQELCVGSSLEFLRLGRPVEVEDVDHGARKEGFVDAVRVEIDPSSSVPQLVVSVRFDGVPVTKSEVRPEPKPAIVKAASAPTTVRAGETEAATEAAAPPSARAAAAKPARVATSEAPASKKAAPTEQPVVARDAQPDDGDELDEEELASIGATGTSAKLRAASEKAKAMTEAAAAKLGPAMSSMGTGMKSAWSTLRGTVERRREARAEERRASMPKRVTAPPPSGALTSAGRRLVRQESGEEDEPTSVELPKRKRGVMMGAAAGLVLVVGLVGASKLIGSDSVPEPQTVTAAERRVEAPQALPPIPGAPATAEVPLFGATPLSTTEQVVAPAPEAQAAIADAGEGDEGAEEPAGKPEASETVREWGEGEVKKANVLKIRMDGPIEGFVGEQTEDGFAIKVPSRKSLSTSSALVRKDKRLAGLDVVNREQAAEVVLRFKGEAPPYKVKVRGDRLEIALGSASVAKAEKKSEPKKVATKSTKKSTKKKKTP